MASSSRIDAGLWILRNGDTLMLWFYALGMFLGLLMLVVLAFFPGTSLKEEVDAASSNTKETPAPSASSSSSTKNTGKTNNNNNNNWHDLSTDELEKVRKQFRLTPLEMKRVLEASRKETVVWTPHQKMNMSVYFIFFTILVYVLNRDYGQVVTIWFLQIFPKEARILGIVHPDLR